MAGNSERYGHLYGKFTNPGQMDGQDEQGFSASPQIPPPLGMAPHCAQQNVSDLCPPNSVNPNNVQHYPISSTCQYSQNYVGLNKSNSEPTENSQYSKNPMLCGPNLMDFQRQYVPMPEPSTPDKDSIFDFRGDVVESYFSRDNFIATSHHSNNNLSDTLNKLSSGPFSRLTHPRKSPPLKRYNRTPSPPRIHAQPPQQSNGIAECYYTGSVQARPVSAMAMSNHVSSSLPSHTASNPNHCATAMLRSTTPNPTTSCAHSMGKNSITVKSHGKTRTIAILNRNNRNRPLHNNSQQQQQVIQPQPVKPCAAAAGGPGGPLSLCPHRPDGGGEGHDHKERGKSELNTSLTNIGWLEEMAGIEAANGQPHSQQQLTFGATSSTTSISSAPTSTPTHKDMRVAPSEKQIAQISAECGRKKRPPYSYMHLIQMAICSREDKHLTLKEIYKWIEDKFPYYKYHPNQGWKNSIRHNLSLYEIFERKKVSVPGKSGTSYWTLREDLSKPLPNLIKEECGSRSSTPDLSTPACDSGHMSKSHGKKAPVPLLPKPDPKHGGYALIPVQGGVPIMSSTPIIVPATWALSHSGQSNTGLPADYLKSRKRNFSTEVCGVPNKKKQMRIAPKMDLSNYSGIFSDSGTQSSCSWMSNTSSLSNSNLNALAASPSVHEFSDVRARLSNLRFVDSGIELSTTNDPDAAPVKHSKRSTTPRKSKRKQKLPSSVRIDSETVEDERCVMLDPLTSTISNRGTGINDILGGIEKCLTSPAKMMLRTPPSDSELITSTPFKDSLNSPSWISPIQSITPGDNEHSHQRGLYTPPRRNSNKTSTPFEGGMLDTPEKNMCTPSKLALNTPMSGFGASPSLKPENCAHLGPGQVFGLNGLTPLKSPFAHNNTSPDGMRNASFQQLFDDADFRLDNDLNEDSPLDFNFPELMK